MKIKNSMLVVTLILLLLSSVEADVVNGGKGLLHSQAAWVPEVGRLTLLTHTRFWGKVGQFHFAGSDREVAETIWDVRGIASLNYGLGQHFGLTLTPVFYQDVHQGDTDEYPWDTFIGLTIANFGPKASSLKYGIELNARFPTGTKHNVIYEQYTAGTAEFGFTGLLSYAYDPLYPEDALNVHLNLSYLNHNDVGEELVPDKMDLMPGGLDPENYVSKTSQQGFYAIGLSIPTEDFNYGLEMYGNMWLQRPPLYAAGRENFLYLGVSVTYKPARWFDFIVSGDFRLTKDNEETIGPRKVFAGMPNYNSWRVNLGGKFTLLPTSVFRTSERDILMQKAETRRELFEQIIKERRETESAEEELERIKEERRKAERELERLRRILEGQSEQRQQLEDMRKELEP
jgi:hypothetical protein